MHLAMTSIWFVLIVSLIVVLHLTTASIRNKSKLGRGISTRQIYPNFVMPPEVQRHIASRMLGFNDKDFYVNLSPANSPLNNFGSSSTEVIPGSTLRLRNSVKKSKTDFNSSSLEWENPGSPSNRPGSVNLMMRNSSSSPIQDGNVVKVNPWLIILCSGVFIVCVSVSLYLFGLRRQRMRDDEELL